MGQMNSNSRLRKRLQVVVLEGVITVRAVQSGIQEQEAESLERPLHVLDPAGWERGGTVRKAHACVRNRNGTQENARKKPGLLESAKQLHSRPTELRPKSRERRHYPVVMTCRIAGCRVGTKGLRFVRDFAPNERPLLNDNMLV